MKHPVLSLYRAGKIATLFFILVCGASCGGVGGADADRTPDPFIIPPAKQVALSTWVELGPIVIQGVDVPVNVIASVGQTKVAGGVYSEDAITVNNQQVLYLRVLSSGEKLTTVQGTLQVGTYTADFSVKTGSNDQDGDILTDEFDSDKDGDGVLNADDSAPNDSTIRHVIRWADAEPEPILHSLQESEDRNNVAADMNHDGIVDIISEYADVLSWRRGLGGGEFAQRVRITDMEASLGYSDYQGLPFEIVDLDRDGKLELVGYSYDGPFVVQFTESDGWQTQRYSFDAFRLVELDGEFYFLGNLKLIPVNSPQQPIALNECVGALVNDFSPTARVASGDLMGTGEDAFILSRDVTYELFSKTDSGYQCEVYSLLTYGAAQDASEFAFYVTQIFSADIDADGRDEVVVSHEATANPPLVNIAKVEFENFGVSSRALDRQVSEIDWPYLEFGPAELGDLDRDGDMDIAMALRLDGIKKIHLYFNQGSGVFSREAFIPLAQEGLNRLSIADLNQDGIPDLLSSQFWLEIIPYREIHIYPGYRSEVAFQAISDDGKNILFSVNSTQPDWFSVDDSGILSIEIPEGAVSPSHYVDATVTATDGVSQLHRLVRVYLSDRPNDFDGDGVINGLDAFVFDARESADFDGDGIGDNSDTDRDNDSVPRLYDIDDFNEDVGQFPVWKNGSNTFYTVEIPALDAGEVNLSVVDLLNDGKDEVLFINDYENGISSTGFDSSRAIEIQSLYKSPENCNADTIIPHPAGEFALFSEICEEDISNIYSLDLTTLSVTPFGQAYGSLATVGPIQLFDKTAGFIRLFDKDEYILAKADDEKIVYYDATQKRWIDTEIAIPGLATVFGNMGNTRLIDINHDGLDDIIAQSDRLEVFINMGGSFLKSDEHYIPEELSIYPTEISSDGYHNLVYQTFSAIGLSVGRISGENSDPQYVCQKKDLYQSPYPNSCEPVHFRDVNQDGLLDLVGIGNIWENIGDYRFIPMVSATGEFNNGIIGSVILQGDFDGDGVEDFLSRYPYGFGGIKTHVSFWQSAPRFVSSPGQVLNWDESLSIPEQNSTIFYFMDTGLDSANFTVDGITGKIQFTAPTVFEPSKIQYQAWLEAITVAGRVRKLLQVQVGSVGAP